MEVIEVTEREVEVIEVIERGPAGPAGATGPQGPAGAAGTGLETLTTQGDTLYRGTTTGERLPIGSTGQVLKVSAQGLPSWANESGAVTSVNGLTGAVNLTYDDVAAAPSDHAPNHESGSFDPIMATAAYVVTEGGSDTDGIYFWDGETLVAGRPTFFRVGTRKNTQLRYVEADQKWKLFKNSEVQIRQETPIGEAVDRPWLVESYDDERDPVVITSATVTRLGVEDMVQLLAAQSNNISTTSESGLLSATDKTKLDGIASGATANTASTTTPSALGTAAAGTATAYAREDHVHAMPSAADVGAAAATHAASHAAAGSDPVFDQDLNTTDDVQFNTVTTQSFSDEFGTSFDLGNGELVFGGVLAYTVGDAEHFALFLPLSFAGEDAATNAANTRTNLGLGDAATADIGTAAGEVAEGNHVHGNLSSDGKVGSTSGLPLVTTTAGAVTTLALGTAGQVLTVNGTADGVEFAAASGGGASLMQSIAVGFVLN